MASHFGTKLSTVIGYWYFFTTNITGCQVYGRLFLTEIEHRYWLLGFVAHKYSHMNITPLSAAFMVIFTLFYPKIYYNWLLAGIFHALVVIAGLQ